MAGINSQTFESERLELRYLMLFGAVLVVGAFGFATAATADGAGSTTGIDAGLEREVGLLGSLASGSWRALDLAGDSQFSIQEIGGSGQGEVGAVAETPDEESGPSNLGQKVTAGALSAVLPGAGQFYNGQQKKAFIMAGAEVAIWTAYFVFDTQGDNRMESAREYAGIFARANGAHDDRYWQSVGAYLDSDAYNEDLLREARALQEEATGLLYGDDAWQWVNNERRRDYQKIRADGNSAYDRRDFMILFAVVNRAISVVDAVIGAGSNLEDKPGTLQAEVLGLDVEMGLLPSWRDPGARCVVSRRF